MLSKKTIYAFRALTYLAQKVYDHNNEKPTLISEIAKEKKIPVKFLESILLELKKHGLLFSKKGKRGGYYLEDAASTISLAKIIRIMDGPIALLPCISLNFYKPCENCEENCRLSQVMKKERDASLLVLENTSIQDLVQPHTPM